MVVIKFFGCDVALATLAGRCSDVATAGAHQRFPLPAVSAYLPATNARCRAAGASGAAERAVSGDLRFMKDPIEVVLQRQGASTTASFLVSSDFSRPTLNQHGHCVANWPPAETRRRWSRVLTSYTAARASARMAIIARAACQL
jgi:hypothetical protein